jgi:PAS domain S-box-containing protein
MTEERDATRGRNAAAAASAHPADPHLLAVERVIAAAADAEHEPALVRDVLRSLCGVPGIDAAVYYSVDRRAGVARLEFAEGVPDAFLGAAARFPVAMTPYVNVFVHRQPVFAADYVAAAAGHAEAGGFLSFAAAPVIARDDVIGALHLFSRARHDWGAADQVLLPAVGRELGATLARLQAEQQLVERRLPIQDLFDSVGELLVVSAADGRLLWANGEVERRLGYSPEDWPRMTMLDIHPPGRRLEAASIFADLLEGEEELCTIPLLTKGGSHLPVETRVRWGTWDGRRVIFGVSRDTSADLRAAEERERLLDGTLDVVAAVARSVDAETAEHAHRVARLSVRLAREMGLSQDEVAGVSLAAGLHDVGLVAVPHEVLTRPGRLTEEEFELVKTHPGAGRDLVRMAKSPWPLADTVMQHHERLDGSGYPDGLRGDEIIPEARIVAVADVIEAMSSERPYRRPYSLAEAMAEIVEHSGTRYDSDVVVAAVHLYERGASR